MFGRRPASSHGFRFHILPAAAGLLAALAALVALPLQAQAQTAYVSNIGQSENASALGVSSFDQGQGFTTGAATAGYVLASVDIKVESSIHTIVSGSEIPTVTIVQGTPTGTVAATLTKPASIAADTTADYTFTAPANTTLSASTTYYVVMEGGLSGISAARTNLDAEDSGGESDWSIADVSNWRSASSTGSFSTTSATLMIKVKGPGTVVPTNTPAEGKPTISGPAQVGRTLTAATAGITDDEGLTMVSYEYKWLAAGTVIGGATSATYTPTSSVQGDKIAVRVTFDDDEDNPETLTSDETAPVVPDASLLSRDGGLVLHADGGT